MTSDNTTTRPTKPLNVGTLRLVHSQQEPPTPERSPNASGEVNLELFVQSGTFDIVFGFRPKYLPNEFFYELGLRHAQGGVSTLEELKKYSRRGAKYRNRNERPRPDLPANAPANRTRKQFSVAAEPDLIQALNERSKELGVDRNSLVLALLRAGLGLTIQPK
jgi:hypothetical protein